MHLPQCVRRTVCQTAKSTPDSLPRVWTPWRRQESHCGPCRNPTASKVSETESPGGCSQSTVLRWAAGCPRSRRAGPTRGPGRDWLVRSRQRTPSARSTQLASFSRPATTDTVSNTFKGSPRYPAPETTSGSSRATFFPAVCHADSVSDDQVDARFTTQGMGSLERAGVALRIRLRRCRQGPAHPPTRRRSIPGGSRSKRLRRACEPGPFRRLRGNRR